MRDISFSLRRFNRKYIYRHLDNVVSHIFTCGMFLFLVTVSTLRMLNPPRRTFMIIVIIIIIVQTKLQQLKCKSEANNWNWICIFVDCFFRFSLILGHPSWWWNLGARSTGNCRRGWQYFAQPAVQLSNVDRSDWSRFQQQWPAIHWWISGNCFSKQCPTSKFKKNNKFSACMVLIENSAVW